jgi:hypothetical protein
VRAVPRLCEFYPGICLTTEEQARKNHSRVKKYVSQVKKKLSQVKKNLGPGKEILSQGKGKQRCEITKSGAIGAPLAQFCAERVLGLSCVDRESRDGIAQLLKYLHPPTALQNLFGATGQTLPAIQPLFMSVLGTILKRSNTYCGISQAVLKTASLCSSSGRQLYYHNFRYTRLSEK